MEVFSQFFFYNSLFIHLAAWDSLKFNLVQWLHRRLRWRQHSALDTHILDFIFIKKKKIVRDNPCIFFVAYFCVLGCPYFNFVFCFCNVFSCNNQITSHILFELLNGFRISAILTITKIGCLSKKEGGREGGRGCIKLAQFHPVGVCSLFIYFKKNYVLFDLVWQLVTALGDSSSSKCKDKYTKKLSNICLKHELFCICLNDWNFNHW